VPDRHVADQRAQHVLVEHLRDEPLLADREDAAVQRRRGDSRRLLAAMLEREQREVGQTRDIVVRRIDAEHTALVAGAVPILFVRRQLEPTPSLAQRLVGFARVRACKRGDGDIEQPTDHEPVAGDLADQFERVKVGRGA